ncbi:YeiH family protein [Bhargavaea ullalensis]|uniref:Integral membrane protein (TIGR00698 family) n=1 Tax=Bhargavaea ullalensis TaxID=1265685 RepID=A0ABV2GB13_9BACL
MKSKGFWTGIGLTLILAVIAKLAAGLPYISLIGPLVFAILLGMLWNTFLPVKAEWEPGTAFASKKLLRAGIILLGMRLNLADIAAAGWPAFSLAAISVVVGIAAVYAAAKVMKSDPEIGFLTACGTGICGAAAIVAVSTQKKSKPEETAVSVAIIAIMGTLFTFAYALLYPVLGLGDKAYGMFAGGTLHEIAHVVAAGDAAGAVSLDYALVVKLTRVVLLVFVASAVGFWAARKERGEGGPKLTWKTLPIPWFIFGFLAVSALYSTGIVPEAVAAKLVDLAYLLMAMAMAGLGLGVSFSAFRRAGMKPFVACLIGSIVLAAVVYGYVVLVA